jgi:hypothetical protein
LARRGADDSFRPDTDRLSDRLSDEAFRREVMGAIRQLKAAVEELRAQLDQLRK